MRSAAPLTAIGDRTFGSLRRHRNYRLFFAGSGISFIGTWMQQIAAYWLILDLTDSAVAVGVLALVQTLPVTALALVGGSIADRVDLRRMIVACETVMGIQAGLLCVLALTGLITAWQLYVLGLVQGVAVALNAPARHTLVFQIVGRDDLTNAIALSASLGTTARILGPAVGGVVVAAFGPGVAFGLNAASYTIVICALLAMRLAPRAARTEPLSGVMAGVGQSFRFAVSSRRVAVTFFTLLLVSTFAFNFDVLLPLLARL
ncbi:MAG: MFS transporter, partial [Gaiellaceae bacterium]